MTSAEIKDALARSAAMQTIDLRTLPGHVRCACGAARSEHGDTPPFAGSTGSTQCPAFMVPSTATLEEIRGWGSSRVPAVPDLAGCQACGGWGLIFDPIDHRIEHCDVCKRFADDDEAMEAVEEKFFAIEVRP